VVGTIDDAVDRLRDYEAAGVGRVMLQHQRHTDVDMVPLLGEVARRVGAPAEA
jgi:alkanesulfonate monooxygenase SsuD/methylene tetrahydromethanopterin reductase-like flavin-dependent oxidoreductase (luciferase family)